MTLKKKKLLIITTCIILAAVVIVICVNYFTGNTVTEFDGTLVQSTLETMIL